MDKRCTACGEAKARTEFNRRSGARDGLQAYCRVCVSAKYKARPKHQAEPCVSRVCGRCGVEKPSGEFHRSGTNRSGYHSYCRPCSRQYYRDNGGYATQRERFKGYRVARAEYVRARKVALGCADCGEKREPVLEFHHVDPTTKSATLNQLMTRSANRSRLDEEMAKCIILCRNCHAMHHHHERVAKRRHTA